MSAAPFVARVSRVRTGLLVLLGLGFVALGVWLVERPGPTLFGWVAIVVFSTFVATGARELFRTEPVLEIDAGGLVWRRWSDRRIPWTAIDRVVLRSLRGQHYLCVWLADRRAYRSTRLLGRLAAVNRAFGLGDMTLNPVGTDRSLAELVTAVKAHTRVTHAYG